MSESRITGDLEDMARAQQINDGEGWADRLTFALMLPVAIAVGIAASAPFLGLAWRTLRWAAGT